jgi:hypothetical protein
MQYDDGADYWWASETWERMNSLRHSWDCGGVINKLKMVQCQGM